MDERPPEMFQRDRPVVDEFDENELLYYRVTDDDFEDGELLMTAFRAVNQSVNRGSLGPPEFLLFPVEAFGDHDVVSFEVAALPRGLQTDGGFEYGYRPQHVPLPDNYPHSEVQLHRNGNVHHKKPPPRVKLTLRQQLANACSRVALDRTMLASYRRQGSPPGLDGASDRSSD